jgi:signal transduction histidine kinase
VSDAVNHEVGDERPGSGTWLPAVLLLGAFLVAGAFTRHPHSVPASVAGTAVAVGFAYAGVRPDARWGPVWLAVAAAGVVLAGGGTGLSVGHFGLCIIAFLAVPTRGPRAGGALIGAMAAEIVYRLLQDGVTTGWLPWLGGVTISALGGVLLARQRSLLTQLRAAQTDLAERSAAAERVRIARDLHDVLAHSLTVSLLHVTAARLAVEHDPADAARALAEAERLGRESLDEVRSIVGLMRAGSEAGQDDQPFAPTPGMERIPELIDRFRNAGVTVSFDRVNGERAVPRTVGTTVYRIIQEALTNAVRHAPGGAVAVRIRAVEELLELTVDSAGAPGAGQGSGLATMRERAEAVGGTLSASAAQVDGVPGWRVLAELPTPGGARWR